MSLRKVIIESPFAGDVEANVAYARRCVRHSVLNGESPLASHLLFTQKGILNDQQPDERKLGIEAGHAWLPHADLVAVYTDRGLSEGMNAGIDAAQRAGIPIEYRRLGE